MPCSLDCQGERSLVPGTGASLAPRLHASSFGKVAANPGHILVVYFRYVIHTEGANSAPSEKSGPSTPSSVSWSKPTNHVSFIAPIINLRGIS